MDSEWTFIWVDKSRHTASQYFRREEWLTEATLDSQISAAGPKVEFWHRTQIISLFNADPGHIAYLCPFQINSALRFPRSLEIDHTIFTSHVSSMDTGLWTWAKLRKRMHDITWVTFSRNKCLVSVINISWSMICDMKSIRRGDMWPEIQFSDDMGYETVSWMHSVML